jgi:O-antigen/teichoic acid export membrane protein
MLNGVDGLKAGWLLQRAGLGRSKIARGIIASYLNSAVGVICNLVLIPVYLASLGRDEYGLWMVVSGLVAYLSLLNLGIVQTTSVRFATAVARGELDHASRLLATGLWTYAKLAAIALVCLIVVGPWLPWGVFVKGAPALEQRATMVLLTAAAGFLVELPLGVFGACLRSIGRIDRQQGVAALQNVARVVIAVAFLRAGGTLVALIILLSMVNVICCLLQYGCLKHELPGLKASRVLWDADAAREMRSPSRYYFLLQIAGAIAFGSDTVIISSVVATSLVAPYVIAQKLVGSALGVVSTVSLNFAPAFLEAHARRDLRALRMRFRQAMGISVVVGAVTGIGLLFAGPGFIRWWVGPGNFVGSLAFLAVVGLMFVQMMLIPCDQLLVSTARHKEYALAAAWEAIIGLAGALAVGPLWGVVGIAWVRLAARVVGAGPVMIWRSVTTLNGR